jgi:hypothetical protein
MTARTGKASGRVRGEPLASIVPSTDPGDAAGPEYRAARARRAVGADRLRSARTLEVGPRVAPLWGSRTRHTPLTGDDGRLWQLGMIVTGSLRLLYLICECRACGLKSVDQTFMALRAARGWNVTWCRCGCISGISRPSGTKLRLRGVGRVGTQRVSDRPSPAPSRVYRWRHDRR